MDLDPTALQSSSHPVLSPPLQEPIYSYIIDPSQQELTNFAMHQQLLQQHYLQNTQHFPTLRASPLSIPPSATSSWRVISTSDSNSPPLSIPIPNLPSTPADISTNTPHPPIHNTTLLDTNSILFNNNSNSNSNNSNSNNNNQHSRKKRKKSFEILESRKYKSARAEDFLELVDGLCQEQEGTSFDTIFTHYCSTHPEKFTKLLEKVEDGNFLERLKTEYGRRMISQGLSPIALLQDERIVAGSKKIKLLRITYPPRRSRSSSAHNNNNHNNNNNNSNSDTSDHNQENRNPQKDPNNNNNNNSNNVDMYSSIVSTGDPFFSPPHQHSHNLDINMPPASPSIAFPSRESLLISSTSSSSSSSSSEEGT